MEITKRLPRESIKDFQVRLCANREQYNLTWNDIAEIVNVETGDSFSGDKYRKWFSSYSEGFDDGLKVNLEDDEIIQEYEQKKIEIQKMKIQLSDQKREFTTVLRNSARFDAIKDELLKGVGELANSKPLTWKPIDVKIDYVKREAVIILSDWHKGSLADNYWNKFNNEEFTKRVEKVVRKTIEYCKQQGVKVLHVFILGDMVSGIIHTTTRIWSMENVISQTQSVSEVLAECVVKFANEIAQVNVYNIRGNHDRVTPNLTEAVNGESFSDFIPWYLKARLAHVKNVKFVENTYNDEIIVTNVAGFNVIGVHGHKDRPDSMIQNLTLMLKLIPNYVICGHYHHSAEDEVHGIEWIMNGTLSGTDEYAVNIRKTAKPAQKLLVFEQDEGRICTYNIRLDI